MGSRVYDIKKKFEGLCEVSQEPSKIKSNPSRPYLKPRSSHLILPQNIEITNSNLRETGSRGNIKRSHAFRSDRNNRNPSSESGELLNCIKSSDNIDKASFKSNNTNGNQCSLHQESKPVFRDKECGSSFDCSSPTVSNNLDSFQYKFNCSNKNKDRPLHFESTIETKQPKSFVKNEKNTIMHSSKKNEFSPVSKHVEQLIRPRPSLLEINVEPSSLHRMEGDGLHTFVLNEGSGALSNGKCNNFQVNSFTKEKNKDTVEDNSISNTLKKVLSSPLPSGPPPKKPPRTFAHTSESTSTPDSPTSNSHAAKGSSSDDLANLQGESLTCHKPIVRPVRSKTESQIMLKKLEIALSNHHQQGRIVEPKNEENHLVGLPSKTKTIGLRYLSNTENIKGNIKHLKIDQTFSLPDSPNVDENASAHSGCFGVGLLSCSNSVDLMRSSHIYDIPFESMSQFYVKDINERVSGINSSPSKDISISGNKNSLMQIGRKKSSDKFSEEHIYAKPHNNKNQLKTLKSKPETSSVSQLVKIIDSNGKNNSTVKNKKELKKPPDLHYMVSYLRYLLKVNYFIS